LSSSRNSRGEGDIWQRRFWEHRIRDHNDWRRHTDYIHYNPVKHGYVSSPRNWQWSSFHSWVEKGIYDPTWGNEPLPHIADLELH